MTTDKLISLRTYLSEQFIDIFYALAIIYNIRLYVIYENNELIAHTAFNDKSPFYQ